jgi:predicted permease
MNTLLLLLPDLALIATGAALARWVDWSEGFWSSLEKLVYYVLFPALLFTAIVRNRIDPSSAAPFALGVLAVLLFGIALGALGGRLFGIENRRFSGAVQCAFRFNSYVALALAHRIGGDAGVALCAVMVAVAVPTGNIAAVWFLARNSGAGVFKALLRNPLVLATACGLAANLTGIEMPEPLTAFLNRMGAASIALGLILVGAGLKPSGARGDDGFARYAVMVKLLAMPMAALVIARALGLAPLATQILVLFGAVPSASACYILATRMGSDGPYVARLITASTLISAITLPLWLAWAG